MTSDLNNDLDDVSFDPNDEVSYYFGNLSREDVKDILNDASIGTFLIRDSTKDVDQKVLCVKEAPKCINNYKIIHKLVDHEDTNTNEPNSKKHVFYLFGKEDCLFKSIPNILEFYSNHYLNQSPLIKPAFYHKKVICVYDFLENGDPNEDLYFKKGDILTIVEYTQGEHWWKASNQTGSIGLIPVPLIRRIKPNEWLMMKNEKSIKNKLEPETELIKVETESNKEEELVYNEDQGQCPFNARVIEDYTPSPYEHSCISLRKGQIVTVLEMKSMGKWYGQLQSDGRKGLFPFNRVEILKQ